MTHYVFQLILTILQLRRIGTTQSQNSFIFRIDGPTTFLMLKFGGYWLYICREISTSEGNVKLPYQSIRKKFL